MEGAARVILDSVSTETTAASRAASTSLLRAAAKVATEEDSKAITTVADASINTDNPASKNIAASLRALLRESQDAQLSRNIDLLDSSTIDNAKILRLETLQKALTNEEFESLKKITRSILQQFPDSSIDSITRFSRGEQHALMDVIKSPEARSLLHDTRFSEVASTGDNLEETRRMITSALEEVSAKEPRFARVMNILKTSAKVTVAGTGIGYCAAWIANYMNKNSGPFVTRMSTISNADQQQSSIPVSENHENTKLLKDSKQLLQAKSALSGSLIKKRIRDPYPCGFSDKHGDEIHPLDKFIRSKVPDPCTDWRRWDSCGGWASTVPNNSRLYAVLSTHQMHSALQALNGAKLSCEDVTLRHAVVALVHDAGYTVGSIIRASARGTVQGLGFNFTTLRRIICIFASFIGGYYTYKVSKNEFNTSPVVSVFLSVLTSLFILIFAFILCETKVETKRQSF